MWFFYALLAAFFYALLWVLGRASRGIPGGVVTTLQFSLGPLLLPYAAATVDFPWAATWWQWYLLLPLCICPLVSRALTKAVHTTEVTLVKPLFGLSSIATLGVAITFFGEEFSGWGILGIVLVTMGLLVLYHERWRAWRQAGPWMVLAGALIFGANAAVAAVVVRRFPHPLAISTLYMTGGFLFNAVLSWGEWRRVTWSWRSLLIVGGMAATLLTQDLSTFVGLMLGPSPYVVAVKRTSVLMVAAMGYLFLRERSQSLPQLLLASGLVVVGIALLTLR